MAARWPALWKERPHASKRLSAVPPSSISSASMEPNPAHMETAGIQDNRGGTSRVRGDKALWPMPNTRRRPSCYFKARAIQRIPKASPKRCTAHCDKRGCQYSYFSFHVKTTVPLEEILRAGRAPSHGPARKIRSAEHTSELQSHL